MMKTCTVSVFGVDVAQLSCAFMDAQGDNYLKLLPPGQSGVCLLTKAQVAFDKGRVATEYREFDSDKPICYLAFRESYFARNETVTVVTVSWEPPAQQFADGVLAWLAANFRTDYAPAPTTGAEPAGMELLTESDRLWYKTLLACKDAYGNGAMTWQQIGDRRSVSGKTAKRKLQALQARRLPGLDDWPDRRN